jgi:hypothetical protein
MGILTILLVLVIGGLLLSILIPSGIKGAAGKLQTVDAFFGEPINRLIYTDWDGDRLYFCCSKSKDLFFRDPSGNLQKIHKKGILLDKSPMK